MSSSSSSMSKNPNPTPNPTSTSELCPEQREVFDAIFTYVTRQLQLLLFVSGTAGSGKSYLIEKIVKHARDIFNLNVSICAPTGTSAKNVGGDTIHSLFKLGHNGIKPDVPEKMRDIDLLIIDEVSMCSADLFNLMDERLRAKRGRSEMFGGCSILMFGDLLQLRPVKGNWIFQSNLWAHVKFDQLTQNHRQKQDPVFAERLNRWRLGKMTLDDRIWIEQRRVHSTHTKGGEQLTKHICENGGLLLTTRNEVVDDFNKKIGEKKFEKRVTLHKIKSICGKRRNVKTPHLEMARGTNLMITKNLINGLRNGSRGRVIDFVQARDGTVERIDFLSDDEGARVFHIGRISEHTSPDTVVTYFPVKLAYACTYHKVQGQTLYSVVVDPERRLTQGQLYVGKLITRGRTVISADLQFTNGQKLFLRDSWQYIPMPLKQMPKAFDLVDAENEKKYLTKGTFPYLFNMPKNYGTRRDTLPDAKYYDPEYMKVEARREFEEWYESARNTEFVFDEEILAYCQTDVEILAKAMLNFMQTEGMAKKTYFCFNIFGTPCQAPNRCRNVRWTAPRYWSRSFTSHLGCCSQFGQLWSRYVMKSIY